MIEARAVLPPGRQAIAFASDWLSDRAICRRQKSEARRLAGFAVHQGSPYGLSVDVGTWSGAALAASFQNSSRMSVVDR